MTHMDDEVMAQARVLASSSPDKTREEERTLLRLLGASMRREEACFEPTSGVARIVGATEEHHEVRLTSEGAWKIGSAPERDLLATWGQDARPRLADILDAIPRTFASARIGKLVDAVRDLL